jgi:predicted AlkP superfamily phosphohydrolase/phosphomutase
MKNRVVILGIDGGTFAVIEPLIRQGRLPNFRHILENGTRGSLASTFPPMTFPAWNTFMTGVNPGRHGVFDFTERVKGKYAVTFTNAQSRQSRTMWSVMSELGCRLAVMGVPLTYPPEPINGVMVSGFDTPVGGLADASVFHPPELHADLHAKTGGYEVSANIARAIENNDAEQALKKIHEVLAKKITAALTVFDHEPWDFFMALFGETDLASHHFWRHHDPQSPLATTSVNQVCREAINSIYQQVDAALGEFLHRLPPQTTLLVMSDHGFGGNSNRAIYLNRWLEREGLLSYSSSTPSQRIFPWLKSTGLKYLPQAVKVQIFRRMGRLADTTESMIRFSGIDWRKTTAYSEETPYFPSIWLNLEGREPQGTVPCGKRQEVVTNLLARLRDWQDPETGAAVFKNVYRKEDLYSGPYLDNAPDILLEPNLIDGNAYLSRQSRNRPAGTCLDRVIGGELESALFQTKSGSHRSDGVFIGYGEPFPQGERLERANIIDLAPTIFNLMGLPAPKEWEGRSLLSSGGIDTVDINLAAPREKREYTEEQARLVRQRLRDLGYLE